MSRVVRRSIVPAALAALTLSLPATAGPPQYFVTGTVSGSGSIVLDPDKASYQKNNIVIVTAVPDEGHAFDRWEGDLAGTANPATLRVSGDHAFTAFFVEEGSGGGTDPGGGGTDPGGGGDARPPLPEAGLVVGYFAQWTIYRRGYLPRHIVESGSAGKLDVINYAFAGIDENLRCASLDTFADYGKRYDASESVDGVADTVAQPLKGNFNQLRKLKALYPQLRVLLSIGGWTESHRFSDAALPENREAFVQSCIDLFVRGNLEPGISAEGVFDGLDIDWEYPGSCGNTCDYRAEDKVNFPSLLAEFRKQLEALENEVAQASGTRPQYLLTIAAPAGAEHYGLIDIGSIHGHLDWINVMAYDFHGGWESAGPANHHAALYQSACESPYSDWGDKAVQAYLTAGVPGSKLLLGVPFYGRGWRGVSAVDDGLCQEARGLPRGTYEKGVDDYEVIAASGDQVFSDPEAAAQWTFDGNEFWSFDGPKSLGWKSDYVESKELRGIMFWELSGDTPRGDLLEALRSALPRPPAP